MRRLSLRNLLDHIRKAMAWAPPNPEAAKAQAVLNWAWNVFDEGGWLCPTLSDGTARLDRLRWVLAGSAPAEAQDSEGRSP